MYYHSSYYFAQAYGEGAYGEGTYSCTTEQQANGECTAATGGTGGTGGSGTGSGGLADTGVAILAVVTAAFLVMFAAMIVRIWRRPKLVPQEIATETPEELIEEELAQRRPTRYQG
jgi:hypothetical protein